MKLEEVLPAYRDGKKIRRKGCMEVSRHGTPASVTGISILADDWEIIEENPYETGTFLWAVWETEHDKPCVNGRGIGLRTQNGAPWFTGCEFAIYADFYAKDWRHA